MSRRHKFPQASLGSWVVGSIALILGAIAVSQMLVSPVAWIGRLLGSTALNENETRQHAAFVQRMLGAYSNTSKLNAGLTLRDVALKTRASIGIVTKHMQLLSAVQLADDEFAVIAKTRRVIELMEETVHAAHYTAIEGRSFFNTMAQHLDKIAHAYTTGEYAVIVASLGAIEERIDSMQRRYAEIQLSVHRAYVETGEVDALAGLIAVRLSREGQSMRTKWPVEKISAVAGLGGVIGGFVLMWASPVLGFVLGASGGTLAGIQKKVEDSHTGAIMADDAVQLQLLAGECQSVMYGLQRFNVTLDAMRIAVRDSRLTVSLLKHRTHTPDHAVFSAASEAVRQESMHIVEQHDLLLDTWYN